MNILAFDFETFLIEYPDNVAPRNVCLSWAIADTNTNKVLKTGLVTSDEIESKLDELLNKEWGAIVCANSAFELSQICVHYPKLRNLICSKVRNGDFWDVQILEKLYLISTNGDPGSKSCSLAALVKRYLGEDRSHLKEGDDIWRLRYSELIDTPLYEWPRGAVEYAIGDSVDTANVFMTMIRRIKNYGYGSANTAAIQVAFDFYARMATINGMEIDQESVNELELKVLELLEIPKRYLIEAGYMSEKGNKQKKKLQQYIIDNFGTEGPKTPKGAISTSTDALHEYPKTEILTNWLNYMKYEKLLTTYIPQMKFRTIHPNFNCIVKTGRSSGRSSNYYKWKSLDKKLKKQDPYPSMNTQNLPRAMDVRPCFKARDGHVLVAIDFAQLELCSIAQFAYSKLGLSDLRNKINNGIDLHSDLGCAIMKEIEGIDITYNEFISRKKDGDTKVLNYRQQAKPITLGVFGGQGHKRIQEEINKNIDSKNHINEDQAKHFKNIAKNRYREAKLFFGSGHEDKGYLGSLINGKKVFSELLKRNVDLYAFSVNGRYHNNRSFCATANGVTMQCLSSDGAKAAFCSVSKECICEDTVLSGCKVLTFIHDEIIFECPDDDLIEERINRAADLMIDAMQKFMPDLRITVEASVMSRWLKNGPFLLEKKYTKPELSKVGSVK